MEEKEKYKNGTRPLKFTDVDDVKNKIDAFFAERKEAGDPPTIGGLAIALGTNRMTLLNIQKREEVGKVSYDPEIVDMIYNAKDRCEDWIATNMLKGKANPIASIFNLKNNYGWKDKSETDITTDGEKISNQPIVINMPKMDDEDKPLSIG